ncbi:MAG: DUF167 domain-containing protein [Planctomycetota bacterium]|nr:MAG: DUF167 domain-containing protein [Planctomycetota bacterium]
MTDPLQAWLSRDADGAWLIRVKAVPGASRDEIAGALGDRLKIRVSAPPEGGKANKKICVLIARALGAPPRAVTVAQGRGTPFKTLRVAPAGRWSAAAIASAFGV